MVSGCEQILDCFLSPKELQEVERGRRKKNILTYHKLFEVLVKSNSL